MADLIGRKVAVVSGYVWEDLLTNDHPEVQLVPVPTIGTALEMVSFGVVDAMVGDQATTTYFIQREGLTNLRVAGKPGYDDGLAIGVRRDWPELVEILEAALATITPAEKAEIHKPLDPSRAAVDLPAARVLGHHGLDRRRCRADHRGHPGVEPIAAAPRGHSDPARSTRSSPGARKPRRSCASTATTSMSWSRYAPSSSRKPNDRMKRDLEAAARVQQSLLPSSIPDMQGIKFSWHYRPCDELAGDILNVFRLDCNAHRRLRRGRERSRCRCVAASRSP